MILIAEWFTIPPSFRNLNSVTGFSLEFSIGSSVLIIFITFTLVALLHAFTQFIYSFETSLQILFVTLPYYYYGVRIAIKV